jgi:hypothetical protein
MFHVMGDLGDWPIRSWLKVKKTMTARSCQPMTFATNLIEGTFKLNRPHFKIPAYRFNGIAAQ